MNSPILEYLASYGIDPAYIIIGLLAVVFVLIILYIIVICKMRKLFHIYKRFMKGKDMESMEEVILAQFERMEALERSSEDNNNDIKKLEENIQKAYQKAGLVKYDAFREMSGGLSYSLALLDKNDNGVVVSSMYSREGCYSYAKEIIHGESSINLSEEEKEALKKAVNVNKITE